MSSSVAPDEVVALRIASLEIPGYGSDEVRFLARALSRAWPSAVFEWGTNRGSSARIFYEASVILDLRCEVFTVELPLELAYLDRDHPGEQSGLHLRGTPVWRSFGDGADVSLRCYRRLRPERALFYVDGDHRREQVERELSAVAAAAPSTPLVLHDSRHLPEVADAISYFLELRPRRYEREDLASDAGMTALWPRPA